MAKLTILVVALVALSTLALAQATSTTITEVENNPRQQQRCHQQIQRQQNLRDCQSYLQEQVKEYDDAMLNDQNPQQKQELRKCCQQLKNLDEQCRCEGVNEAVRRQNKQGKMQGEERRKMMQQAENLPSRCNLSSQQCQISK